MEELKGFKDKIYEFAGAIAVGMLLLLISTAIVIWSIVTLLFNIDAYPVFISFGIFFILCHALYGLVGIFVEKIKMLSTLISSIRLYLELKKEIKQQIGVNSHE